MFSSKIKENAFFAVFFGSLFLFFLWPLIALTKTFSIGDYHTQFYPWSFDYARQLAHGRLPFWTDLMTNGFPMVAEGQVGPYYLPHLAAYFVLPFRVAYTWSIPIHILIGGIGAYVYAKRIGLSKEGAALAAVVFSFSSAYGGCFYTTGTLRVLAWLPWMLLLLERSADKDVSRLTTAGWLAAATGFMWTAGFPQIALYAEFYLFLYAVVRFRFSMRPVFVFLAASAVGAALAAPQILPTLELASVSTRAGQGADFALWGSVPPPAAVSLLFPEWGALTRVSFYIGIAPFFLVAAACVLPKRVQDKTHLFLAALFFLLAIGKYNPFVSFLASKISAPAMRNPSKFLFFTCVSLGFAAGWALDQLRAVSDERLLKRLKRIFIVIAFFAVVVPGAAGIVLRIFEAPVSGMLHALADRTFLGKKDPTHDLAYYHVTVDGIFLKAKAVLSYAHLWTAVAALLAVATMILFLWSMGGKGIRRAWMPALLAILVVADLASFGRCLGTGFIGNAGPFPREKDLLASHLASKITAEDGLLVEFVSDLSKEIYEPSFSMLYSLPHAGGYSPLLLKRYYELTKDLGFVDASLGRHPYSTGTWKVQRGVLDALGVSYILSDIPLDLERLHVEEKVSGRYLYRNTSAVPPVYAVYRWKALPDTAERLAYLKGPEFRPAIEAVVERPLAGGTEGSALDTRWLGTERRGMKTVARAELAADAVMVFRTSYYPRWKAFIDRQHAEIFPVNHAFIGVSVPKGIHEVSIVYDEAPHVLAQRIAVVGWVLVLLMVCLRVRKRTQV